MTVVHSAGTIGTHALYDVKNVPNLLWRRTWNEKNENKIASSDKIKLYKSWTHKQNDNDKWRSQPCLLLSLDNFWTVLYNRLSQYSMLTYNRTYHSLQKKSHSVLNTPYSDNLHQFSKAPKKENDDQNKKSRFYFETKW